MDKKLSKDFLDKKRDYSPLLVHLTKDTYDKNGKISMLAREVLQCILDEPVLRAYNYYCVFTKGPDGLDNQNSSIKDLFKVTCFTETPLDQIDILLEEIPERWFTFKPYGLVFKKEYIRQQGGNPVFYVTGVLSKALWRLYKDAIKGGYNREENKLLALVNKCDDKIDFHWEREWRIVGNLQFKLNDVYCGLCPKKDMPYFESKYEVIFIDPTWGINKILDKLVNLSKEKTLNAADIPF